MFDSFLLWKLLVCVNPSHLVQFSPLFSDLKHALLFKKFWNHCIETMYFCLQKENISSFTFLIGLSAINTFMT